MTSSPVVMESLHERFVPQKAAGPAGQCLMSGAVRVSRQRGQSSRLCSFVYYFLKSAPLLVPLRSTNLG